MERHGRFLTAGITFMAALFLNRTLLGAESSPRNDAPKAAIVNGETITLAEVDDILKARTTPLTAPTARQTRSQRLEVVSALIDDMLIRQYLRQHGPKVDAGDIEKQLNQLRTALSAQGKNMADYLRDMQQTEAQFKASIMMLLQLDKYMKQHTSEDELKRYYTANKDYFDKVTVRTSHIVIRLSSNAPSEEREKANKTLQTLRSDIVAGKIDFAKAAKEYSQCPSAPKGGDIGFIFRKFQNVDEEYARAAFSMKVGELSNVVQTDFGCHLIKVTERTEGKQSKYEQCAEEVRDSYSEELRMRLLTQLRKQAKVEVTLP